jgi:formate dehydrogenase major subunit
MPKLADGGNYSWLSLFEAMYAGDVKGFFAWGQNPAVGGANANMNRKAMENLDWMVAVNLWDVETSSFWQRPGVDPADIETEVFLLPAAASVEKEGSITNSGRWGQWRWKAVDPPGEAKADSWIMNQLMIRLRNLYKADPGPNPDPILKLAWDYGPGEVDPHRVAKEVNGWAVSEVKDADGNVIVAAGKQVKNFTQLRDDGSTASANWLYSGSYNEDGNMMARRDNVDHHPAGIGLYKDWAWAWPVNRRIIYNRASCNAKGEPFDPDRFVIRWTGPETKWEGDVPDGGWPPEAKHAFIMKPEGHARIFGPGRADGPFPTHYEPWPGRPEPIPPGGHHLPAFGALAKRGDDAQPALAGRDAARHVRRDEPRTGCRKRHPERRKDYGQVGARLHRGRGHGYPAYAAPPGGWTGRSPGRFALALGLQGVGHRWQRQRADPAGRRCQHDDSRNQGVPL